VQKSGPDARDRGRPRGPVPVRTTDVVDQESSPIRGLGRVWRGRRQNVWAKRECGSPKGVPTHLRIGLYDRVTD